MMGIVMKKVSLSVAAILAVGIGSASAADLGKVYTKAAPMPVVSPWDIAFGGAIMSDYIFRGITQSNHKASGTVYIEPRYNINPNLQLYVGTAATSISFPNRAAAEIDVYGGIRPTFGPVAFDFGVFGYLYPGGSCFGVPGPGLGGCGTDFAFGALPFNGNFAKKDASFFEGYGKVAWTVNDAFTVGANVYYSPNFLNTGADGTYVSGTAKYVAPSNILPWGLGSYISGEFGHQFLGTPDAFYNFPSPFFGNAVTGKYADYSTWNVGIGFTKSVFTLDLRYSDTNLSQENCNYFTSDFATTSTGAGGAFTSKWCGATFIAKLGFDLTAAANLK